MNKHQIIKSPTKVNKINNYATLVRESIELNINSLSPGFTFFPGGACGAASDVLGTYLVELGYIPIHRILKISRIPEQNHSHTWLEHDNLLIDITADQFNDHPEIVEVFGHKKKVIVTENKTLWYNIFNYDVGPLDKREAHFKLYDELGDFHTARLIERDYLKVLNTIPKKFWPEKRK